jgi:hypothetical protein
VLRDESDLKFYDRDRWIRYAPSSRETALHPQTGDDMMNRPKGLRPDVDVRINSALRIGAHSRILFWVFLSKLMKGMQT